MEPVVPAQVLIADDSPTIRGFVKIALRGLAIELVEAEDGAQGLTKARASQCALALVDVQMPNLDGLGLLRALREDPREDLRKLPVLLLTAERGEDVKAQAEALGAAGFLMKPLQLAAVRAEVEKLLGGPA